MLRIRSRPEAEGEDSIYRYDRAALLSALRRGKGRAMADLLLIVRLAGRRVAFPASAVEARGRARGHHPGAARRARHVAGLSALRSRVLTVIDGLASLEFGARPTAPAGRRSSSRRTATLMRCMVEEVEDVVEAAAPPTPLEAPLGNGWDRVAIGMVEAEGELVLLVDPHCLIAGPAAHAA